tara:strand:+ start:2389 stop:3537 length:1149 start_codon:yes stop_codon:yes gene_type:complete
MFLKIFSFIFILIFLYGCNAEKMAAKSIIESSISTGISKNPKSRSASKKNYEDYNIDDVQIKLIKINKLTDKKIDHYNKKKLETLDHTVKKHSNIYDYKYEYVLGPSDIINVNLTDTDDIDDSYKIDENGMIDLPFAGKVKINDLSITQAHNILTSVVQEYYKNPDLQIDVEEFNSSKVYVIGAVGNQLTINLDQEPINLIDAAIQAKFNPGGEKSTGTKGYIRRDNNVYKINLSNAFQSKDDKENFYLKKNDVIFIDRNSEQIHVFGEVTKPGVYYPNMDYSLTELISTSGLNQLTADAKKIYVIREDYSEYLTLEVFQLDITNPVSFTTGRKFKLLPKDIVYVPPTKLVKWNRVISLLLPQTDLFKSYNPIIQEGVSSGG